MKPIHLHPEKVKMSVVRINKPHLLRQQLQSTSNNVCFPSSITCLENLLTGTSIAGNMIFYPSVIVEQFTIICNQKELNIILHNLSAFCNLSSTTSLPVDVAAFNTVLISEDKYILKFVPQQVKLPNNRNVIQILNQVRNALSISKVSFSEEQVLEIDFSVNGKLNIFSTTVTNAEDAVILELQDIVDRLRCNIDILALYSENMTGAYIGTNPLRCSPSIFFKFPHKISISLKRSLTLHVAYLV